MSATLIRASPLVIFISGVSLIKSNGFIGGRRRSRFFWRDAYAAEKKVESFLILVLEQPRVASMPQSWSIHKNKK
jgi:hypothetical protein